MSNITIFRQHFVNELLKDVSINLTKYQKNESWLKSDDVEEGRYLSTNLDWRESPDLKVPADGKLFDLENSVHLHKALPRLTRLQARDPRLWTKLTHEDFWDYMLVRWNVTQTDEGSSIEKARSRYFVSQSRGRALVRNGIARLWWIAECSYDEERDNPYELTSVLLATLDITQTILERTFGRSKEIVIPFLEFIVENRSTLLEEGNASRYRVRELAKFINIQGGVGFIDFISRVELKSRLRSELDSNLASLEHEVQDAS